MTTAKTLPHPSDLKFGQALLCVHSYSENTDTFDCMLHDSSPAAGWSCELPAPLLPMLVHEYDEPDYFIGRTFLVEKGAKKADYDRCRAALSELIDQAITTHHTGKTIGQEAITQARAVYDELPKLW